MKYQGGKAKIARPIAAFVNEANPDGSRPYYEPFVGAASVLSQVKAERRNGSDTHADLILLLTRLRDGWKPPTDVSREMYRALKSDHPSATRGFVGHACSWGGKWFGGYASSSDGRNYADEGARRLLELNLDGVVFSNGDYRELEYTEGGVIYCDPPYSGTTQYRGVEFDSESFWTWAEGQSETCTVFVSELSAPDGWECVWQQNYAPGYDNRSESRVEKLFRRG